MTDLWRREAGQFDKLPVMAWGDGGCAINSARYSGFFTTIASHGFLVIGNVPEPGAAQRQHAGAHVGHHHHVGLLELRVGGLVKPGSLVKSEGGKISFVITDNAHDVAATYQGQVPDLFREGQGVVAEGALESPGKFHADTILAKHDERYMPREVVDALKKQGRWQEGGGGS